MTDIETALAKLAAAQSVQDVVNIANSLSAAAVNSTKGAILYSGQVGAATARQIAVNIANLTGLNIIDATPRAQFLSNSSVRDALARIYTELNPAATPLQIKRLVTNELFGGNATSLWGRASAEFVGSIKGAVTVVAQSVNPVRVFGAVEIPVLLQGLASKAITSINGVVAKSLPTASADLISVAQNSFMSALAKGAAFSAAASTTTGQLVSSEVLAGLALPTKGAQTAAQYAAEGLADSTAPALETAAAGAVENLLAVGGSKLLGLLGQALKVGGNPYLGALIYLLTPSPLNEGEDEYIAQQNAAWLALDTPAADQTQLAVTTGGTTSANIPLISADGSTHDGLALSADPSSGTATVAMVDSNDTSLTISSVSSGKATTDDQITEVLPQGIYDDQISVTTDPNGVIAFTVTIEPGDVAEVGADASLATVRQNFTFASGLGTLKLDNPSSFFGTISSFQAGDTIDLVGSGTLTNASFGTNNVLTLTESGGSTVTLDLDPSQDFSDQSFLIKADGSGGTNVVAVSDKESVTFSTADESLLISKASNFSGTISGFRVGDTIDLAGVKATTATLSNGVLMVQESGGGKLALNIESATKSLSVVASSDGSGGTYIESTEELTYSYIGNELYYVTSGGLTQSNVKITGTVTFDIPYNFTGDAAPALSSALYGSYKFLGFPVNEIVSPLNLVSASFEADGYVLSYPSNNVTLEPTGSYDFAFVEGHITGWYLTMEGSTTSGKLLTFQTIHSPDLPSNLTPSAFGDFFSVLHFLGSTPVSEFGGSTVDEGTWTLGSAACFCAGTHILTVRGEIPVEALQTGDGVLTLSGKGNPLKPIVWIGRSPFDVQRHPRLHEVVPIRIRAGALGDDLPHRDLVVSPGHALFIDGVLIQAERLVNGCTIIRDAGITQGEYFHVELAQHDILLSEGVPSESYLDTGNRSAFVNSGGIVDLHPDFSPKHWAETCAPLVQEGPMLAAVKARLLQRAFGLGYEATTDHGLHIVADGVAVRAIRKGKRTCRFVLPPGSRDIRLVSRIWTPSELEPVSTDTRQLGVFVSRMVAAGKELCLRDEQLSEGWHSVEEEDGSVRRWTSGNARLPANLTDLEVELWSTPPYWSHQAWDEPFVAQTRRSRTGKPAKRHRASA